LLDPPTVLELQDLANAHEFGLAYNASDNMRALVGMQLAGEIITFFNNSINSQGANKVGIQFGSYNYFLSFFGLTGLPAVNNNFTGIPDYASSMVFELFSSNSSTTYPNASDLKVRFFFSNGSTYEGVAPTAYPLFGSQELSWADFSNNMSTFAVTTTEEWCHLCGNTTGTCAPYSNSSSGSNSNGSSGGHKMSLAVAGVIGAMVTLAVVLGAEALIALVAGLRVVRKGSQVPASPTGSAVKA
jgi:hypothetical protein